MDYDRERLIELVKRDAVKFGDFVLASGKKSKYYIDCRNVSLSADGAIQVGAGILDLLADVPFDAIGGLTLGADPVLSAVLTVAGSRGRSLRGFIARKESKEHGTGRQIEGPLRDGDRVVIVDDVATTGGSCFKAIDAVLERGCEIAHVVVILDRLAGAAEAFADKGYPFSALLTIRDLGIEPSGG